jgi:hypothetical protein
MQIYVFITNFSRLMCYDTVLWYDTTLIFLFINYGVISAFCIHVVHDTSYDILTVSSLKDEVWVCSAGTQYLRTNKKSNSMVSSKK